MDEGDVVNMRRVVEAGVANHAVDAVGRALVIIDVVGAEPDAVAVLDPLRVDTVGGGEHPAVGDQRSAALVREVPPVAPGGEIFGGPVCVAAVDLRLPRRRLDLFVLRLVLILALIRRCRLGGERNSKQERREMQSHLQSPGKGRACHNGGFLANRVDQTSRRRSCPPHMMTNGGPQKCSAG